MIKFGLWDVFFVGGSVGYVVAKVENAIREIAKAKRAARAARPKERPEAPGRSQT